VFFHAFARKKAKGWGTKHFWRIRHGIQCGHDSIFLLEIIPLDSLGEMGLLS
jgi:hypothetical protein